MNLPGKSNCFPKPVVFNSRLWPNYLWHMLAAARIGYDSDYADRFGGTVASEDLDILRNNRDDLVFGEGEGGSLSAFFGTFAGALPIETPAEIEEYFAVLARAFEVGRLGPFVEAYPESVGRDRFFRRGLVEETLSGNREQLLDTIGRLSEVYLRSYRTYVDQVWPEAQRFIGPRQEALGEHFRMRDYIAVWESLLGIEWDGPGYEIVLCYANKNGPDYNSLGYNANLIYFDKPFDRTWQFVSHEIGTHLLIDLYMELAESGRYDQRELYAGYECLAMFYNRRVLESSNLAYEIPQFESERRLRLFESIYHERSSPREVLQSVLED